MTRQRTRERDGRARLLISTSTLPTTNGDGVPRFVLDLALSLTGQFDVTVLAPLARGARRAEVLDGVNIHRFRYGVTRAAGDLTEGGMIASNLRRKPWLWLMVPALTVVQAAATLHRIRSICPVAVNAHWLVPQGLTTAIACLIARVPMILHVHAGDVYLLRRVPLLGRMVVRFVLKRSSHVFADGSHVKHALDELIGGDSGAELRPMGVWLNTFKPADPHPERIPGSIVFVGRLVEKKGLRFLLEAMVTTVRARPDARLTIIGSGPLNEPLRRLTCDLGLQDCVEFVGSLPHGAVAERLHRAWVACVPSVIDSRGETDGMPTVVIEAMAAGLPVVGSEVDGIPDVVIDGVNGRLTRPGDSTDIASKLLELLEGQDWLPLSEQAGLTAEVHSWEKVADTYLAVIGRVARG